MRNLRQQIFLINFLSGVGELNATSLSCKRKTKKRSQPRRSYSQRMGQRWLSTDTVCTSLEPAPRETLAKKLFRYCFQEFYTFMVPHQYFYCHSLDFFNDVYIVLLHEAKTKMENLMKILSTIISRGKSWLAWLMQQSMRISCGQLRGLFQMSSFHFWTQIAWGTKDPINCFTKSRKNCCPVLDLSQGNSWIKFA